MGEIVITARQKNPCPLYVFLKIAIIRGVIQFLCVSRDDASWNSELPLYSRLRLIAKS